MGGSSSAVSRVRSGGPHRSTLVTSWKVRVTGIEFIHDYLTRENGNNLSNKGLDAITYRKIRENFKGWGPGPYLLEWDWKGSDNLKRAACHHRQKPVSMRVRLHSTQAAPSLRNVHPSGRTNCDQRQGYSAHFSQCKSELAIRLAGTDSGSHHWRRTAQ